MLNRRLGRTVRKLRQRARLTQLQLGARCGLARWKIGWIEADRLGRLRVDDIAAVLEALDAELELRANYRGAAADRLLDEAHAVLVAAIVEVLTHAGWEVRVETSFSEFGERGSIDVLAWRAAERAVMVIEVKSEVGSIEATLRGFDVKCRLAPTIVNRFGWRPMVIGRVVVLPEERTARRAVERHAAVLDTVLPARSRRLRTWIRTPSSSIGGIWFMTVGDHGARAMRNPSAVRRVRAGARPTG